MVENLPLIGRVNLLKGLHMTLRPRRSLLYMPGSNSRAREKARTFPADGVHLDLEDNDGLAATCQQGRDLGCDGKSLIHPGQLVITNEIFSPSEHEI